MGRGEKGVQQMSGDRTMTDKMQTEIVLIDDSSCFMLQVNCLMVSSIVG